jgi:hypothetical protein
MICSRGSDPGRSQPSCSELLETIRRIELRGALDAAHRCESRCLTAADGLLAHQDPIDAATKG